MWGAAPGSRRLAARWKPFADSRPAALRRPACRIPGARFVDANLDAPGIRGAVAFSISLDDVFAGKPDPEPFREAARRFALPAQTIVAVEDSVEGARSAREAGPYVVSYAPDGGAFIESDRSVARLSEIQTIFEVRS
jgi:beta-phosphoglucomutase-like phosphatase (HAD superfamily)